ncbi:MAG: CdaR family protein [Desulfitobacterium sp.]
MKELLQRNLGYKLISLVLAILFWLWVTSQGTSQTLDRDPTLTLSLVTKNTPANSVIMTKLPSVRVKTEGYNPSINVNEIFAYVDLSGSEPGEHEFEVKVDPIPNMKIVEITPRVVTLQLDTVEEKMLPVTIDLTGQPAPNNRVEEPIVKPSMVNVRGPSSLLNVVDKVLVELSVAGASDTFQVSRPLLFRDQNGSAIFGPDPSVETITSSPTSVDIIVPIVAKELETKRVPLNATTTGTPVEGKAVRSVRVIPNGVQVFGEPEALDNFNVLNIGPVNINGISSATTYEISSDKVSLPDGLSYVSRTSFSVIVEIGNAIQDKTFYNLPIAMKNLPQDLVLEQPLPPVSITVRAYPEVLEPLTHEQIALWLDATGKAAGEYTVKPYWQLPAGVEVVSVPDITYTLKAKVVPENPGKPTDPDGSDKPSEPNKPDNPDTKPPV